MPVGHQGRHIPHIMESRTAVCAGNKDLRITVLALIEKLYQSKKEKEVKVRKSWRTLSFKKRKKEEEFLRSLNGSRTKNEWLLQKIEGGYKKGSE